MDKPNRAERRKSKFGGGRASDHGGWPTSEPNPALGGEAADQDVTAADSSARAAATPGDDATAGAPDQDQTHATGPGTGGATEQAGRAPRHEGVHGSNSTKG
jgi:hypothetical protein